MTLSCMMALEGFRALRAARPLHEMIAVRQFIELIRSGAVAGGTDKSISINTAQVALSDGTDCFHARMQCVWGAPPGALGPPGNPVHPITKPCTFPGNQILCSASGALSAGTLYCAVPAKNEWYALTASVGDCGPIRLYQYRAGIWVLL